MDKYRSEVVHLVFSTSSDSVNQNKPETLPIHFSNWSVLFSAKNYLETKFLLRGKGKINSDDLNTIKGALMLSSSA